MNAPVRKSPILAAASVAGDTHVGLIRNSNEDSYLYVDRPESNALLAAVADGMGGHEFGEVASFLAMRYVLQEWQGRDGQPILTREDGTGFIYRALHLANDHIYHVNRELKIRWCMGTTVTLGVFFLNKLVIAQVGDSRCYRVRRRNVKLLTTDQSWREEMVQNGIMTEGEAAAHPLSNMLTNCVGAMKTLKIEFTVETVRPGERYLFCTDGLSSMVPDDRIFKVMRGTRTPAEAIAELVRYSLHAGGTDNITAVGVFL